MQENVAKNIESLILNSYFKLNRPLFGNNMLIQFLGIFEEWNNFCIRSGKSGKLETLVYIKMCLFGSCKVAWWYWCFFFFILFDLMGGLLKFSLVAVVANRKWVGFFFCQSLLLWLLLLLLPVLYWRAKGAFLNEAIKWILLYL